MSWKASSPAYEGKKYDRNVNTFTRTSVLL
jgi:hypothetical protein